MTTVFKVFSSNSGCYSALRRITKLGFRYLGINRVIFPGVILNDHPCMYGCGPAAASEGATPRKERKTLWASPPSVRPSAAGRSAADIGASADQSPDRFLVRTDERRSRFIRL